MNSDAFRRTQSLRYPRVGPGAHGTSPSSSAGSASGSLGRKGGSGRQATFRSKSSRTRFSMESQSLASRLTASQRIALTYTWRIIKQQQQVGSLMRRILQELELVSPKVKEIFFKATYVDCFARVDGKDGTNGSGGATFDEHIKLMIKFFDELISDLDNSDVSGDAVDNTALMIKTVGQQHAILNHTCGFQPEIWEQLGEIAMEKVCALDPVQKTREAGRAWRTLIAFVTDKLRCGFEGEAKIYSRRPSSEHQTQMQMTAEDEEENGQQNHGPQQPEVGLSRRLEQLRTFDCYDDVPVVGGNRLPSPI